MIPITEELIKKLKGAGVYVMYMENTRCSLASMGIPVIEECPFECINESFMFEYTPQGFDFWKDVCIEIGEWL